MSLLFFFFFSPLLHLFFTGGQKCVYFLSRAYTHALYSRLQVASRGDGIRDCAAHLFFFCFCFALPRPVTHPFPLSRQIFHQIHSFFVWTVPHEGVWTTITLAQGMAPAPGKFKCRSRQGALPATSANSRSPSKTASLRAPPPHLPLPSYPRLGYEAPAMMTMADMVHFRGRVKANAAFSAENNLLFTLPEGMRPPRRVAPTLPASINANHNRCVSAIRICNQS